MAPSLALVSFLFFQRSLAHELACAAADGATALMQTSLVQRTASAAKSQSSGQNAVISMTETDQSDKPIYRPHVGKGPDRITFGLQGKNFYGVDMLKNLFTIDMVITLKWEDKRTVKQIPKGAANITLSEDEAQRKVWLPEIVVTNREGVDTISTGVILNRDGQVIKVQRVIVKVDDKFKSKEYPFDTQDLAVNIASSQYLSGELVLEPDSSSDFSGVPSDLFTGSGFSLDDWAVTAFEDQNGLLKKSRGVLTMKATRLFGGYMNTHLIPAICIIMLSCSVFHFPFTAPFVVPRVAMSILAYLTFSALAAKSDAALPPSHPVTWNDILNQNLQLIQLVLLCFNIYTEYRHHVTKVEAIAQKMNFECKILSVSINAIFIGCILLWGAENWGQTALDITLKFLLALFVVAWVVLCEMRTKEALRKKPDPSEETSR